MAHSWLWRPVGRGITKLQAAVQSTVEGLGYAAESEACTHGMSVDIWVPDLALAIEVDGPLHYAANQRQHALGPTRLKRRLLHCCGVSVLCVPFHEWPQGEAQRRAYMRRKLCGALPAGGGCREGPASAAEPCRRRVEGDEHAGSPVGCGDVDAVSAAGLAEPEQPEGGVHARSGGTVRPQQQGPHSATSSCALLNAAHARGVQLNLVQYQHGRLSKQQLLKKAAMRQIQQQRRGQQ